MMNAGSLSKNQSFNRSLAAAGGKALQFAPDVVIVLAPVVAFAACEVDQLHIQRPVAKGADVLDLRGSDAEHTVPGTGIYRHSKAAEATAAPIPLVKDNYVKGSGNGEEVTKNSRCPSEILTKTAEFHIFDNCRFRD